MTVLASSEAWSRCVVNSPPIIYEGLMKHDDAVVVKKGVRTLEVVLRGKTAIFCFTGVVVVISALVHCF